jgi:spermidine synthase
MRLYFQDGLVQNVVGSDNLSMSFYTYALEALSYAYRPELRSALVLGIGAGMVPMRLAGRGVKVDTVDIDPASLRAATEVFGFDAGKVGAFQADARTFLRGCNNGYDIVIVDLFHGDGVPDYLATRDFFRDLKRCLGTNGIAVFNTFAALDHPRPYAHFLMTLRAELPYMTLYRPDYGLTNHINSFVVAAARPLPAPVRADIGHVPQRHLSTLENMLNAPRPLDGKLLEHGRVITDARNAMPGDFAASQMTTRRYVLEVTPPAFLVN